MKSNIWILGGAISALAVGLAWGQSASSSAATTTSTAQGDRIVVPFRDANRPRTLSVELINGGITVRGYDGKDAIIETRGDEDRKDNHRSRDVPPGMHRIDNGSGSLDIIEDNNIVHIKGGISRHVDVVIQVPMQTALSLKTLNGGGITVENVSGEIDADNLNGPITVTNASGSVLAHSNNGKIIVSLNKILPDKAMSFSTLNGEIDVSLPADVKANVRMRTDNGDIFTDFDIKVDSTGKTSVVEDGRDRGGRYRVHMDRNISGTINGGGPEMQFRTLNGRIMIHKK